MRTALLITAIVILTVAGAFTLRYMDVEVKSEKKNKKKSRQTEMEAEVKIIRKSEVPPILREISAIVYLNENRFACVQDELGTIYIYNTALGKIEKEIPFSGPGDFEGLAIVGKIAYALRSDGHIFEVKNFEGPRPQVRSFSTHLTAEHNTEGLCYDYSKNRLLVAIKGKEKHTDAYKGIYSFNLATYKMDVEPAFKIDFEHPLFAASKYKKKGTQMQPSAIAIHPKTKEIYITEAASPKVLVLDAQGNAKSLKRLRSNDFYKPEGIAFSTQGTMFISNEGKKEPGNILEVAIQ